MAQPRPPRRPKPAATAAAPWGWALTGALIGLAVVLVTSAPARWLASAVASASAGAVVLADPQGSVWSGSARLVLTGGAGSRDSAALPGRVQWQIAPTLRGLNARITAACCTRATPLLLHISPRWGGARLTLADSQTLWPASLLTGLGTPLNTVQPQGELALDTHGLQAELAGGRIRLEGSAEITARQLSSRLSTLQPLGSYRLQLRGGDAVALNLSTLEGSPLLLSGEGQLTGARLRFNGEASAAPGMEAQLANLLNILGRRQGGKAVISFG